MTSEQTPSAEQIMKYSWKLKKDVANKQMRPWKCFVKWRSRINLLYLTICSNILFIKEEEEEGCK